MMTGPAKTQMTLLESMRDDATFPNVRVRHDPRPCHPWRSGVACEARRSLGWRDYACGRSSSCMETIRTKATSLSVNVMTCDSCPRSC